MNQLVTNIAFDQAVTAIREIVLDVNPVQCFSVSGQGFPFIKSDTEVTINTDTYDIDDMGKLYKLVQKLVEKQVIVTFLPDYSSLEATADLINFNFPNITEPKVISRKYYFSDSTINSTIVEFYSQYLDFTGIPQTIQYIYDNSLDYTMRQKMLYWVAYWLLDKRRAGVAAANALISGDTTSDIKNTTQEVTTTVGDVFRVVEKDVPDGNGVDGFTSLWGDRYGYYTKMQLWIRHRFENLFKDYSLRDNVMVSSQFTMFKGWEPSAWRNTLNLSPWTRDIFLPESNVLW